MTGEVIVSNFEYCYHSPRMLPSASGSPTSVPNGTIRGKPRRNSLGANLRDGQLSYHILVMELSVPLASTPPLGPYMINLNLPRCLHNSIKLQLFSPPSSRASRSGMSDFSTVSGSTDDERWEVRTIPPLLAPARPRNNSVISQESWLEDVDDSTSSGSVSSSRSRPRSSSKGSSGRPTAYEVVKGTFPRSGSH
jgi:hypothetical protein